MTQTTNHCCQQLARTLGNHDLQPTPAYLSPEDWNSGRRRAGWYPGASGPGYYQIVELPEMEHVTTPRGVHLQHRIQYQPLATCPFCNTDLSLRHLQLPHNWEHAFGYDGQARFVAFYWTPAGDEAMYDDGRAAGDGNWYLFSTLRHTHPELDRRYNLGYSELEAEHWLLLDRETRALTVLPVTEAQARLRKQWPPLDVDTELANLDWETLYEALCQAMSQAEATLQVIQPCDTCFYSIAPGWLQADDGSFDRCPVCNGWGFLPEPAQVTIGEGA
jgi:hypothetical protein